MSMMPPLFELFNRASEKLVGVDPQTQMRLSELEGKTFHLILNAPELDLFVSPSAKGLIFEPRSNRKADVTLHGSFLAFAGYALNGLGIEHESKAQISIQGDLELAQSLQQILAKMDIDREELFAIAIGDMPARKLNVLLGSIAKKCGNSGRLAQQNLCEYLQEEKQILISQTSLRKHVHAVDLLRSRLDRAELRFNNIREKFVVKPQ